MPDVVTGAIGVGAVTGLLGSSRSSSAQRSAANAQSAAQVYATDQQLAFQRENRDMLIPEYRNALAATNLESMAAQDLVSGNAAMIRDTQTAQFYDAQRQAVDQAYDAQNYGVAQAYDAQNYAVGQAYDAQNYAVGQAYDAQNYAVGQAYDAENVARRQFSPYAVAGKDAIGNIQGGNFRADPSYQFRLQEGLDAVEASAAARGGLFSGATGQALQTRGQNEASQEYQNWFARNMGVAGMGMQASGAISNAAAGRASGASNAVNNRAGMVSNAAAVRAGMATNAVNNRAGMATNAVNNRAGMVSNALGNRAAGVAGAFADYGGTINNNVWRGAENRSRAQFGTADGIAGVGSNFANSAGNAMAQYAQGIGAAAANRGDATAAGWAGASNAITGGINNYLAYDAYRNMRAS